MGSVSTNSFWRRIVLFLVALSALGGEAAAQAFRVKDIHPGSGGSYPFDFARLGTSTLFMANPTYPQGWPQLWKSDGTEAGTIMVEEFGSLSPHMLTESGGLVFFRTLSSANPLWRSDGTAAGTFPLTQGDSLADRFVQDMVTSQGTLYFSAEAPSGYELWLTGGTSAFRIASFAQPIRHMAAVGGTLFFLTGSDNGNASLWKKSDGIPATLVRQLPGRAGLLTSFRGQLFFAVDFDGDFNGRSLWKSDGTEAGTQLVKSVTCSWLTAVGQTLFFAGGSSSDLELWKSDGTTEGTVLVKDITPGVGSEPEDLSDVGGRLFFTAQTSALGREIWRSDGTAAGTVLVKDVRPGFQSGVTEPFLDVKGVAYFVADDGVHGSELWRSDGTEAGTLMVHDVSPGPGSGLSILEGAAGGFLYFAASDGSAGLEPWALPVPPTAYLAIAGAAVTEGNSGTIDAVFTVTLSAPSEETVTVDFATRDLEATAGSDYIAAAGTSTFPPGVTTNTVTVSVNGDALIERDERFSVRLSNPTNAPIDVWSAIGTIVSDDLPAFRIDDVTVMERNSSAMDAVFTVSLAAPAPFTVMVNYATADGTATAWSDFSGTSGTLAFLPGMTSRLVRVSVYGDTVLEPDETFFVNLSDPTEATIEDGQGVGTIGNDDFPAVRINDASVTEGNGGATNAGFTASLSAAAPFTVTVDYATADGTAASGTDYVATGGTLTFAPGVTAQGIAVSVSGDTLVEPDETFFVNLSSPTNVTVADGQGVGTIRNDDVPAISINDVTLTEGDTGTTNGGFTVSLSDPASVGVSVAYATENGSATAGSDYLAASGMLTFPAGTTTRSVSVSVRGDRDLEPDETFFVNLSNAVNATIEDGQGRALIRNDDFVHPGSFFTGIPCRALDTRNPVGAGGPALSAGEDRVVPLAGVCSIPTTAKAVSVNLTVTQPTAAGNLRLYPAGAQPPTASAINYSAGQTRGNNGIFMLNASGQLAVGCAQASGTTHFILDVNGYFE